MNLPSWTNYGKYNGKNYGAHTLCFSVGGVDVYFSYRTPVAFRAAGQLVVRENDWGTTTGKHLNWIDGGGDAKARRLPGPTFEHRLAELLDIGAGRAPTT